MEIEEVVTGEAASSAFCLTPDFDLTPDHMYRKNFLERPSPEMERGFAVVGLKERIC